MDVFSLLVGDGTGFLLALVMAATFIIGMMKAAPRLPW